MRRGIPCRERVVREHTEQVEILSFGQRYDTPVLDEASASSPGPTAIILESLSKRRSVSMVGGAARVGDGGAGARGVARECYHTGRVQCDNTPRRKGRTLIITLGCEFVSKQW